MTNPKDRVERLGEEFRRQPAQAKATLPAEAVYVVKPGDSLSKIAKEQLGDATRWPEIAELNKATLPNPNLLRVGQELKLPG
jgi:nucleoid-associated protein YgaU